MGGSDVGANRCAVGGDLLGVSGPRNPKNSSIWIEKRLRNGSGTARETAKSRPSPRPTLFLEVVNDCGESRFHRTRHRGGRGGDAAPSFHPKAHFKCRLGANILVAKILFDRPPLYNFTQILKYPYNEVFHGLP